METWKLMSIFSETSPRYMLWKPWKPRKLVDYKNLCTEGEKKNRFLRISGNLKAKMLSERLVRVVATPKRHNPQSQMICQQTRVP